MFKCLDVALGSHEKLNLHETRQLFEKKYRNRHNVKSPTRHRTSTIGRLSLGLHSLDGDTAYVQLKIIYEALYELVVKIVIGTT